MLNLKRLKPMNRKERKDAERRERLTRERSRRTLTHAVKFIDKALGNPEWYDVTCTRVMLLRCLGNMIDNILYDMDEFVNFADIDPMSRKALNKIRGSLDRLLDHLLRDSVRRFGMRNEAMGKPEADEFEDVSKMAAGMQSLCELYLMWFVETPWRQMELDKFMRRVVPDEAVAERNAKTLAELHKHYDETRKKIMDALSEN